MKKLRDYLRSLVKGNGSEVMLPWFPETRPDSKELWLIRKSRIEPKGSRWIQIPLATCIWFTLSLWISLKMCRKYGRLVQESYGINLVIQLYHMLRLAWCRNISPLDYYECRFFLPKHRQQAEFFIPQLRHGRLTAELNNNRPTERLDHKLQSYHTLNAAGLPTVEIVEIFNADGSREFNRDDQKLKCFLGKDFFVKPVNEHGGQRVERWKYDSLNKEYSNGTDIVAENDLWEYLARQSIDFGRENPEKNARLVQPLLTNHPDLKLLSKEALNTLRVCSVRFPDGQVEVYYAEMRMGLGDSVSDTGSCGISAAVNLETGCLLAGMDVVRFNECYPRHPDTGVQIEGFPFPMWTAVKELAIRSHQAFPENPLIGWDVAVTPEGPLFIEVNCNPNMMVPQVGLSMPIAKSRFVDVFWAWNNQIAA